MPLIGIVGGCYDRLLVRFLESQGFQVYYIPCNVPGITFDADTQRFSYNGKVLERDGQPLALKLIYPEDPEKIAKKESEIWTTPFLIPDFIIDRIPDHKEAQAPLLRFLESSGAVLLNPIEALMQSASKLKQASCLIAAGVPFPESCVLPSNLTPFERRSAIEEHFEDFTTRGEVIIKLEQGARGTSVFFVGSIDEAVTIAEEAAARGEGAVLQKPILQEQATTLRVNVVGDDAVNAFSQTARDGAKISNNGAVSVIEISPDQAEMAVSAVKAMGLRFGGVDIITDGSGTSYVLEVNTSPDIEFLCSDTNRTPIEQLGTAILNLREQGPPAPSVQKLNHP